MAGPERRRPGAASALLPHVEEIRTPATEEIAEPSVPAAEALSAPPVEKVIKQGRRPKVAFDEATVQRPAKDPDTKIAMTLKISSALKGRRKRLFYAPRHTTGDTRACPV